MHSAYIERFVSLLDPGANTLLNVTYDDAVERVGTGDPEQIRQIDGQFALVHRHGHIVYDFTPAIGFCQVIRS